MSPESIRDAIAQLHRSMTARQEHIEELELAIEREQAAADALLALLETATPKGESHE